MSENSPPYRTAAQHAEDLAETIRLAYEIADERSREDIESACTNHHEGGYVWCLTELSNDHDVYDRMQIERAVRYLARRDKLERHPSQPRLVRCKN